MAKSTDVVKAETPHYPVPTGEKPMTATQMKNLERLVMMDFDDLQEKVLSDITQRYTRKMEAIDAKFGDNKAVRTALNEANKFVDDMNAKTKDFYEALVEKHSGLKFPEYVGTFFTNGGQLSVKAVPEQVGREEARQRLLSARNRVEDMALTILGRERRKVQRLVLLQGVTPSAAQELLNDLPDGQDVMTLLQSELALANQDDIDVLMSED